jgi:hypothetical protein
MVKSSKDQDCLGRGLELVLKACVFYNVFSLLTVFLAHLRGRRSRLGMTWGWLLALHVLATSLIQESKVGTGVGWFWPPPFRSFTAIQAVRGQLHVPLGMYDCVWAQLSGCFRKVNCTHGGKTINRRLVVVQSASPKTITTEKKLPACLTTSSPFRSLCTSTTHGLLTDLCLWIASPGKTRSSTSL